MFIGHFGVGLAAKKVAPGISLGLLFIAVQFLDLLWPTLLLLDVEHVVISPGITRSTPLDFTDYPVTHSLLVVAGWGIAFGLIYWLIKKKTHYAIVLAACVISHWFLDLIVHRPDLPLYPGQSTKFGFGLWNYPMLTLILEGGIFLAGALLYYKQTTPNNGVGKYGFAALILLLAIIHVGNIFGPPPPSVTAIAWAGQLQWLFVLLAFWVDRNRSVVV